MNLIMCFEYKEALHSIGRTSLLIVLDSRMVRYVTYAADFGNQQH